MHLFTQDSILSLESIQINQSDVPKQGNPKLRQFTISIAKIRKQVEHTKSHVPNISTSSRLWCVELLSGLVQRELRKLQRTR